MTIPTKGMAMTTRILSPTWISSSRKPPYLKSSLGLKIEIWPLVNKTQVVKVSFQIFFLTDLF